MNDRFRGLTLHRNPDLWLWQALPARKQYELENSPEFTAIEDEIEALARNEFVDETTKLFRQQSAGASTAPSTSSDRSSPSSSLAADEIVRATETPASSVCIDIFDTLDPRLHD